jgi:hypothetical protein
MTSEPTTNPYPLPHDASEKTRLDTQHFAFKHHLGRNIVPELSPDTARQIIDVGTGSACWAVEVAKEFPKARVTGIDLSYPIFKEDPPPENIAFVVGDVNQGIDFPNASVDLVHSRCFRIQSVLTVDFFRQELRRINGRAISRKYCAFLNLDRDGFNSLSQRPNLLSLYMESFPKIQLFVKFSLPQEIKLILSVWKPLE